MWASCGSASAAVPTVATDPPLYPSFQNATPDYTVRCRRGAPVRVTVHAPAGTRVALDDGAPRGGSFEASVALVPSQALVIRVITDARTQVHYVRCLPRDFPGWVARRDGTPTARWIIVTPSHKTISYGYVAVFDDHGVPVWWMRGDPPAFNGQLLPDGNLAWTRWVFGRDALGHYEERTLAGELVHTYGTGPREANAHELRVLPNGNYFMVLYTPRDNVDLSPWGGPRHATVLDGEIEERDAAGALLWRWTSAGHVARRETARWYPKLFKDGPTDIGGRPAYDVVHMNSVEPVGDRVVVSMRHTDAVYEIDKKTGAIVWKLGGNPTPQSLQILDDPYGSQEFGGQHDARALAGGRTITVHDNGTARGRPPRALAFRVDAEARTARLVRSIELASAGESRSSGSARRLPDGHWVVAWGNTPYVTESTASGQPVLTLQFANPLFSYRAYPVLAGRLTRADLRSGMDAIAGRAHPYLR